MGALTEKRKRCFIDLCFSSSSPHPISDIHVSPASKKPKIQQIRSSAEHLPPPPPFPRQIHAPQRILRVFNLGCSKKGVTLKLKQESPKMEKFLSGGPKLGTENGMRLDEYMQLVKDSGIKSNVELGYGLVLQDLPSLETKEAKVLTMKVEDARETVVESVEGIPKKVWVKKQLPYKMLYEDAKRHDPYLSSLAFEAKIEEERISGFRPSPKSFKEEPKKDLSELFHLLTDEEEDLVFNALHGGKRHQSLVTHKTSNIEITREVLQCLSHGAWLNDEVINLYLELLKERERRDPQKFLKCHFFNTFFYKRLFSGKNGYDYASVKRWTTKKKLGYSLTDCEKIFVPIHKNVHWCLGVIHVKDEAIEYLDSLGGVDANAYRVLARYFMDEAKDKNNTIIETNSWKHVMADNLPQQKNGWDCGMFMLKYTDFYSRGLSLHFSQDHMEYFRKRTAKEILCLKAD